MVWYYRTQYTTTHNNSLITFTALTRATAFIATVLMRNSIERCGLLTACRLGSISRPAVKFNSTISSQPADTILTQMGQVVSWRNDRYFVNDWGKCRSVVIVNKKKKKVREGAGWVTRHRGVLLITCLESWLTPRSFPPLSPSRIYNPFIRLCNGHSLVMHNVPHLLESDVHKLPLQIL